ncbi:MAG: hypothetical protein Q8862_00080 [Bacteroidota bacterium]|nr:hypothetical protein [Bacteroidota bacterium]MDP4204874.1 hypothetical protein [Bacteroidota bacterium]
MNLFSILLTHKNGLILAGSDGLVWLLIIICLPFLVMFLNSIYERNRGRFRNLTYSKRSNNNHASDRKVDIRLIKNFANRPSVVTMIVENNTFSSVDLDAPLVIFNAIFYQKTFRLRKVNGVQIYPLFLESGRVHNISINLNGFYSRNPRLRWFPFLTVKLKDVSGRKYAPVSVFLKPYWLP